MCVGVSVLCRRVAGDSSASVLFRIVGKNLGKSGAAQTGYEPSTVKQCLSGLNATNGKPNRCRSLGMRNWQERQSLLAARPYTMTGVVGSSE